MVLRPAPYSIAARSARFRSRTTWLLAIYAAVILVFFSLSTNQEYYTYPVYFPLLLLTAGALASEESQPAGVNKWLTGAHAALALIGVVAAVALGYGLWSSRALPSASDIGALLAHRDVAGYTLSMSHLFDLTGPSFAALRLPAGLAAAGLLLGPVIAWVLRRQRHHFEATVSVAFTSAVFLIAAHIALVRFEPMLSSRAMADTINHITKGGSDATLILYGDVAHGSSLLFYTQRQALLVNGRVSSVLWGSNYPDAPHVLISDADLLALWGNGPRRFLFVPGEDRARVAGLLGTAGPSPARTLRPSPLHRPPALSFHLHNQQETARLHKFVISTGANPDFCYGALTNGRVCGFQQGKPREVRQRHQLRQEIRGSRSGETCGSDSGGNKRLRRVIDKSLRSLCRS